MGPISEAEIQQFMGDPMWRLENLYWIMVKEADGKGSFSVKFKPNRAQRRFATRLWHRNIILKARQLGFTTLIALLWLDHALFTPDQRCGIIAQDREAAEVIFRDKVKFAYDRLPPSLKAAMPLARDSASELVFAHNNSSIRVGTSMRSGTIHRLHVSEFGKICAKFPDKAAEVVTGSIPAVPLDGVLVIESTAEGREGEFFAMVERAQKQEASKEPLNQRDYRLHFYGWWQEPKYRMEASKVHVSAEDHEYFDLIEVAMECRIDPDQRAWYVATRDADFSGAEERMWQEYPSTPDEAFQVSTAGNYYAKDMLALRKRGGITRIPVLDAPMNTFWDIGNSDGCAIWFHQELRGEDRFPDYYEAHNEDLRHYVADLQKRGYLFGTHFLPHDADHKRLGDFNKSTKEMLQELMPGQRFEIVPRVTELITGIYATRKHMKHVFIGNNDGCKKGVQRLEGYRKKFSRADNRFTDQPDKTNGCSEGADAFRQYAQAKELGMLESVATPTTKPEPPPPPDWRM